MGFTYFQFDTFSYRSVERLLEKGDKEVIEKMQREGVSQELLMHFPSQVGTFLHKIALRPALIDTFASQLRLLDENQVPFLMHQNSQGASPIDIAYSNNSTRSIALLLQIIQRYHDNPSYNYIVDRILSECIRKQVDLTQYFASALPVLSIIHKDFPVLHTDDSEILKGANYETIEEITQNYEKLIGSELKDIEDGDMNQIEYYAVNLPETINCQDKRELMRALLSSGRVDVFENLAVQTIIDFKWTKYTKKFFEKQFYLFLVFTVLFIFDMFLAIDIRANSISFQKEGLTDWRMKVSVALTLSCVFILLYFAAYEVKSAMKNVKAYMSEFWNLIDFALIFLYIITSVLSLIENSSMTSL